MLVECPECSKQVSDRAGACPGCGFPIAEDLASKAAAVLGEAERQSRERVGETDCPQCEARGFATFEEEKDDGGTLSTFAWCGTCEHTGRLHLVKSTRGFFAVGDAALVAFAAGEEVTEDAATFVGETAPNHRYPKNPRRFDGE